jgi:hypothetical protein
VVILFAGLCLLLPIQFTSSLLGDVLLPAFRLPYNATHEVSVQQPTIEVGLDSGDPIHLTASELLEPFPRSHHNTFMRSFFSTSDVAIDIEKGQEVFIHQRVSELFPNEEVNTISIIWQRLTFRLDESNPQPVTSIPLDTLVFEAK